MIGLSLLPSPRPSPFQRKLVRASRASYGPFALDKGRSLGFASAQRYYIRPVKTRSRYGSAAEPLSLATLTQLVGSLCKRHAVTGSLRLRPLAGARFQVLFHSPARGASHLSLAVLVRYRSSAVFSLAGWSPRFRTGFLVPRPTQVPHSLQALCP